MQQKILVTGAAGFIGYHLCKRLLQDAKNTVVGIDNMNPYYDPRLKEARVAQLDALGSKQFEFLKMDLTDTEAIDALFAREKFDIVVNLAAQAGVRYSIENPRAYVQSNVCGFLNVLEGCRNNKVGHLVYASSSSVYGLNRSVPFSEHHGCNHPVSVYAATKKSDELLAHTYSHLYGIPTTGLRFFTVYGPWGRPDMSPWLFGDAILHDRPIRIFNHGRMERDFTYVDDIVEGIVRVMDKAPAGNPDWDAVKADPATSSAPYRIYNIGNSAPVNLMKFIEEIEKALGKEAEKVFCDMQPGDVERTWADCTDLAAVTGLTPSTDISDGVRETMRWLKAWLKA